MEGGESEGDGVEDGVGRGVVPGGAGDGALKLDDAAEGEPTTSR